MPKPITRLKRQAKANVGLRNGDNRTIGDDEKNERSRNSKNATNETQAATTMRESPNQSRRGPSSSTYSSPARKTAIAMRCAQSMRRNILRSAVSMRTSTLDSAATAMPGITLMKKIQRQPSESVMRPPTVGPKVGANTETTPRMAGIIARSLPENNVNPTANTVGTIAPPVNPCSTRNAIIDSMFHANPHSTLDSVNSAADKENSQRVDIA